MHIPGYNLLLIDPESGKGPTESSSPRVCKLYFEGYQGSMEDCQGREQVEGLSRFNSRFQHCHFCSLSSTGVTYKCALKKISSAERMFRNH